MSFEVLAMIVAGVAALALGPVFAQERIRASSGAGKILVFGPVCYAASLAVFSAEHFGAPHDLVGIVPKWLPGPMFWVYFVGTAWLAAAVSFIIWRCVRWSAACTALMMFIIVVTLDFPNVPKDFHSRMFWILTVRETAFGCGAMVLAGSVMPAGSAVGAALVRIGRWIVAAVMVFYGIEHFLYPHNVPGVPLEKITPAWIPGPTVIAYFVGITLVAAGLGMFFRPTIRMAAASAGTVLLLLTAFFYLPILMTELHTRPEEVEGLNYIFDTMLWAGTVLLAGRGEPEPAPRKEKDLPRRVHVVGQRA